MRLAIGTGHYVKAGVWEQDRSVFEAFDLCYNAGFRCFDYIPGKSVDIDELLKYLAQKDVAVIQSHIPFNRYTKYDYADYSKTIMECMERIKAVNSKIAVVHGDEFDFANMEYTPQAALEFNYRLFYPLVEYGEKNGIKVAFESVFEDMNVPRFCSNTEDLCALVDKYNSENVGVCWDLGHAKVQYKDKHLDALKLAGERVICTHIHDNIYSKDLHMYPFMGDTDWSKVMQAFKDIGYSGDFTFEMVYDRLPDALASDFMSLLYKSGEYLLSL